MIRRLGSSTCPASQSVSTRESGFAYGAMCCLLSSWMGNEHPFPTAGMGFKGFYVRGPAVSTPSMFDGSVPETAVGNPLAEDEEGYGWRIAKLGPCGKAPSPTARENSPLRAARAWGACPCRGGRE